MKVKNQSRSDNDDDDDDDKLTIEDVLQLGGDQVELHGSLKARVKISGTHQRCSDPEMLRPHQSADSDHRSATASAGRCCLGSAVITRVRDSLSDSDPCVHLTNRPNGLSTLRRMLRHICRGHKSTVMLPTAVNRSRQNSSAST